MWYVQDYHDFFDMLRKLPKPPEETIFQNYTMVEDKFDDRKYRNDKDKREARKKHLVCVTASSYYAFLIADKKDRGGALDYQQNYPSSKNEWGKSLFKDLDAHPPTVRACHMFSILAWFFDCRDTGACRWQWENHVLKYFGQDLDAGIESEFDKFQFRRKKDTRETDTKYFDNTWFLMTVFLEVNFRNAVAAMHCRLWEKEAHTKAITGKGNSSLQSMAKELYHRQHSLLNTRARCEGLQNVSAGLSWKKNASRNCLRNLLLSSLDDTLPGLDPQLEQYLQQFNDPNAALFLRMIEVSNAGRMIEVSNVPAMYLPSCCLYQQDTGRSQASSSQLCTSSSFMSGSRPRPGLLSRSKPLAHGLRRLPRVGVETDAGQEHLF
jgi:hypothetical protein